jgi:hypothetical protein
MVKGKTSYTEGTEEDAQRARRKTHRGHRERRVGRVGGEGPQAKARCGCRHFATRRDLAIYSSVEYAGLFSDVPFGTDARKSLTQETRAFSEIL